MISAVRTPAVSTRSTAFSMHFGLVRLVEGIAQHHGQAEHRGQRVGEILAGDVRGRTMDRLIEGARRPRASAAPSEAEGSMPSEPVSMAAQSDSRSPNRLSVTMTSNCLRVAHELHAAIVGIHVAELDILVFGVVQLLDLLAPQHAAFHHIGLFHRADLAAALAGEIEGNACDADDFRRRIDLGVDAAARAVGQRRRCRAARRNRRRR